VENERLLTDEEIALNAYENPADDHAIGCKQVFAAGRTDAAKEIFEELKKYDATLRCGTAIDGYFHYEYKKLSELLEDFKSHYGVTE